MRFHVGTYLLGCFSIRVPSRATRHRAAFYEPVARVNTVKNGLFCRLPRLANDLMARCPQIDLLCDNKSVIVRNVRSVL